MSQLKEYTAENGTTYLDLLPPPVRDSGDFEYKIDKNSSTETLVRLFAEKYFARPAYEVIRMLDPVSDLFDESADALRKKSAAQAIGAYLNSEDCLINQDDMDYAASLLGDMPAVSQAAVGYESRLSLLMREDPDSRAGEVLEVLNGESDVPIEYLDGLRFGIDLPAITKLAEKTNVESIIIMAAAALSRLASLRSGSPEQLKTILEIETFYAPLVDVLGFSAFDMTLRNEANKARLVAGGHGDLVNSAREDLVGAEDGIPPIMQAFFENAEEAPVFEINTCMLSGDRIYFGEKSLESLTGGKWKGRLIDRIKTIGSLAHKRLHNEDYRDSMPNDVIGLTAVMENETELVDFFRFIQEKISNGDNLSSVECPSKGAAFSIQGTADYVKRILRELGTNQESLDAIDAAVSNAPGKRVKEKIHVPAANGGEILITAILLPSPPEDAFQVLRTTFAVKTDDGREIPAEFQFQTDEDRYNSRLGGASHIHYKGLLAKENKSKLNSLLGNVAGTPSDLNKINRRKEALYTINPDIIRYIDNESSNRFCEAMTSALSQQGLY